MKTTRTLSKSTHSQSAGFGRKARLASIALGSCVILLAGCSDRDTASREATNEQQLAARDPGAPALNRADATDRADSQDNATMVLNEEQLRVQKRDVDAGGVLITKDVETREVTQPVELRQEQVDIERLTPDQARERGIAMDGQSQQIDEGQVYIPLSREEAVAQKEVETTGVVQAQTQTQTEQREVGATLEREVVDVQRQGAGATTDQGTQTASLSEQRIRSELSSANDLNLEEQQLNQINIKVERDTVRLSGKVPSEEVSDSLEQRIKNMQDVRTVQNDLEVE